MVYCSTKKHMTHSMTKTKFSKGDKVSFKKKGKWYYGTIYDGELIAGSTYYRINSKEEEAKFGRVIKNENDIKYAFDN